MTFFVATLHRCPRPTHFPAQPFVCWNVYQYSAPPRTRDRPLLRSCAQQGLSCPAYETVTTAAHRSHNSKLAARQRASTSALSQSITLIRVESNPHGFDY